MALDLFTRQPDGRWLLDAYPDGDAKILLESIGRPLRLSEVHNKVRFVAEDDPAV